MANQSASASDLLKQADVSKLPELARKIKLAGSWYCPTMVANARAHNDALWLSERELVPAAIVARYRRAYPDDQDPLTSPKAPSRDANRHSTPSGSLVLLNGDIGKQQTAAQAVEAAINNLRNRRCFGE